MDESLYVWRPMYTYVYVYAHVCMYTCMGWMDGYVCMYVCVYVCMYVCVYVCMYVHVCMDMYTCLLVMETRIRGYFAEFDNVVMFPSRLRV